MISPQQRPPLEKTKRHQEQVGGWGGDLQTLGRMLRGLTGGSRAGALVLLLPGGIARTQSIPPAPPGLAALPASHFSLKLSGSGWPPLFPGNTDGQHRKCRLDLSSPYMTRAKPSLLGRRNGLSLPLSVPLSRSLSLPHTECTLHTPHELHRPAFQPP